MLYELAISPAIFRVASYEDESSVVADLCLRALGPSFLDDCIVRNLHNGDWFRQLENCRDSLHPRAKELLKKLNKQQRLVSHNSVDVICPESDEEWENEAVYSHGKTPLAGMIFSRDSKTNRHRNNLLVECPEKLTNADFWKNRPCSQRIPRNIEQYLKLLDPLLRHANFIAFIDPHLDPTQERYKDFLYLLCHPAFAKRNCMPKIEIHRVATLGSGPDKVLAIPEIENRFRDKWETAIKDRNIQADIFLWDDFHDRFVSSELISMNWSNGFDTTTSPNAKVTVSRLSREDRDELQKEFAFNSCQHNRLWNFTIGAQS
jgi:hypothetical protein